MTGRIDGKVAVVTGAGSGIGAATARLLTHAGAAVALVGRRAEPLAELAADLLGVGGQAEPFPTDVTDSDSGRRLVAAVERRFGRLDLLVNNAGLNVPHRGLDEVTAADLRRVIDVNLVGTLLLTQAVLPLMRAQGAGTVVNVSSIAGWRASALSGPAYSAAKAGVNSLTELLNQTERHHGIRACAVCPGEVNTPILELRPQPPSAEARAAMLAPADVAEAILLAATLPQRATVELILITPTVRRMPSPGELGAGPLS